MNTIFALILLVLAACVAAMGILRRRSGSQFDLVACNVVAGTVSTHSGSVSRYAEAALSTAHVLVKQGTADNEVLINGANDQPLGYTDDTAAIDEMLPVLLLGCNANTAVLTAGDEIAAGEPVYTAADGKVTELSAVAGTYYQVGVALTAAAADGDEIEVDTCIARAEVVSA